MQCGRVPITMVAEGDEWEAILAGMFSRDEEEDGPSSDSLTSAASPACGGDASTPRRNTISERCRDDCDRVVASHAVETAGRVSAADATFTTSEHCQQQHQLPERMLHCEPVNETLFPLPLQQLQQPQQQPSTRQLPLRMHNGAGFSAAAAWGSTHAAPNSSLFPSVTWCGSGDVHASDIPAFTSQPLPISTWGEDVPDFASLLPSVTSHFPSLRTPLAYLGQGPPLAHGVVVSPSPHAFQVHTGCAAIGAGSVRLPPRGSSYDTRSCGGSQPAAGMAVVTPARRAAPEQRSCSGGAHQQCLPAGMAVVTARRAAPPEQRSCSRGAHQHQPRIVSYRPHKAPHQQGRIVAPAAAPAAAYGVGQSQASPAASCASLDDLQEILHEMEGLVGQLQVRGCCLVCGSVLLVRMLVWYCRHGRSSLVKKLHRVSNQATTKV